VLDDIKIITIHMSVGCRVTFVGQALVCFSLIFAMIAISHIRSSRPLVRLYLTNLAGCAVSMNTVAFGFMWYTWNSEDEVNKADS
jgi:hypothetical protein